VLPFLRRISKQVLAPRWISVKSGEGIDEWFAAAAELLPEGKSGELFDREALSDQHLRDFAAEYIREQCFLQLGEEIPYSIAVQIESFDETDPALVRIEATLHVERDGQKAIVIGQGGAKIKSLGTKAREKMEALVGHKVFLGLRVKVTPQWSREKVWVERFGYDK
jgi:GTP-binding protein Era